MTLSKHVFVLTPQLLSLSSLTGIPRTIGLSHDLSKRVGGTYDIPHGISSVRMYSRSMPRDIPDFEGAVYYSLTGGSYPNQVCDTG